MSVRIGDSVVVKDGIKEPDTESFGIGGWQGRVTEVNSESDQDTIITVEWDSLTLEQMPSEFIEQSEIDGLDWKSMYLAESDLIKTVARDKEKSVKKIQNRISKKYYWASLGEEGIRISKILEGANPKDEMECLQRWVDHLDHELMFPIPAIVSDSENDWLIRTGDEVLIKSLPHIVDMYGIIATIKCNGKKFEFPLCDLEVKDKGTANYKLVEDYRIWFGNK